MEILVWQVRSNRGLTCRALANKCGLSKSTINNIENGIVSPTLEELSLIAAALDCRITDLFKE